MFLPFILKLLSWMTSAALEELFDAIFGALFLIVVTYASVLPQMVEFFSTKLSSRVCGDTLSLVIWATSGLYCPS